MPATSASIEPNLPPSSKSRFEATPGTTSYCRRTLGFLPLDLPAELVDALHEGGLELALREDLIDLCVVYRGRVVPFCMARPCEARWSCERANVRAASMYSASEVERLCSGP